MSKVSKDYEEKWNALISKNFKGQACWFLNGFYDEISGQAEDLWRYVQLAGELCKAKKSEGSELDEFEAHIFLEKLGETLTVVQLRKKLQEIDLDMNKRMALAEYLIFKYGKSVKDVCLAPQGGSREELAQAQKMVDEAEAALQDAIQKASAAKKAESVAIADEAAAIQREKDATDSECQAIDLESVAKLTKHQADQDAQVASGLRANAESAEALALKAEAEQKAAFDELKAQQDAHAGKIAELEAVANDASKSTVAKSRASNEAAQLKSQDPLPLQRAKINQGATLRQAERARKFANEEADKARDADEKARNTADQAEQAFSKAAAERRHATASREEANAARALAASSRQDATQARFSAEEAQTQVELRFAEATAYLQEVSSRCPQGDIWWLSREMEEKRKYMPKSKGGNW